MEREGIFTEEQLQRSIEAGQWYESEGESGNEDFEDDESLKQLLEQEQTTHTEWTILLWPTSLHEDDPAFMHPPAEGDGSMEMIVEMVLRQLGVSTEATDSGGIEQGEEEMAAGSTQCLQSSEKEVVQSAAKSQMRLPPEVKGSCDPVSMETEGHSHAENLQAPGGALHPGEPVFDDSNTVQPEKPKYYYIAHEIMTTERTYVQSLKLLEKVVHGAIKTAKLTGRTILPESGRKEIFLNIGELYALNFDLLQELEDRIEHWDDNPLVADVLAKRAPFFKLYTMYAARFDEAQLGYCKWLKSCKAFADLIRTVEMSRLCKGLPISSYMLCPIQRIPRYRLLLEDYLRHLPEGHTDIEYTKAALAAISAAAVHMNERINESMNCLCPRLLENQAQVVRIQKTFAGRENIVAPGRRYLGRGPVFLVPGQRSIRKRKQRILFLFSDILLITQMTKHGQYKIQHKLTLRDLLVSNLQSPQLENAFCIAERGMTKLFRFCTKTLDERTKWLKELHKAVTADNERRKSFSSMEKYKTLLNDPETNSSILAVLNDPSFEHSEPSWVRRSIRVSHSTGLRPSLLLPTGEGGIGVGREEVDMGDIEVVTEFVSEENKEELHKSLMPGADNSLSSYMNQRSASGELWRRRWFVLTNRALICYENHRCDAATGALLLVGYHLSVPDPADGITRKNVLKLSYPGKRPYYFQLPNSYDFERWYGVLSGILRWQLTSTIDSTPVNS